ncbi:retron St85 family RNA-directed DNA polymerase [Shewanella vesiculosa]|uniref:retron St85 family RNA-directed DNA polymerase n=1 Tax=Shewanella vesiculosa TaxID=518738 RepID=UPI003D036850
MSSNNIYGLKNLGLPALKKIEDFASATRLSQGQITYLAYRTEHLYYTYDVLKKSGKKREIAQPNRELKAVQAWILRNILDKLSSSPHSKGFDLGTSILENALPHQGANYILTLDLEDFFPSISAAKVYGIFNSIGYNKEVSSLLTNLCVFKGGLPQGAPTSPKLANLVSAKLDTRIHGYAGPKGMVYTRYADDLTLSSQSVQKLEKARHFIGTIITDEDLVINRSKTKLSGTKRQKKITGLVLSQNNVGIGREKLREIRAKIHYLFTGKSKDYSHVNGFLAFTYGVDKKSYTKLYRFIEKMKTKYPSSEAVTELHNKAFKRN